MIHIYKQAENNFLYFFLNDDSKISNVKDIFNFFGQCSVVAILKAVKRDMLSCLSYCHFRSYFRQNHLFVQKRKNHMIFLEMFMKYLSPLHLFLKMKIWKFGIQKVPYF